MSRSNRESALEAVKADADLSAGARFLLVVIGDLVADGGLLTAGCDYLAGETGTATTSVRRWRAELVDAGYLLPERVGEGGKHSNTYRLAWVVTPLHFRTGDPSTTPPHADGRPVHNPSTSGREQKQGRNRNRVDESTNNPSPPRNDPETCPHRAVDSDGWCAACSTQIREAS